MFPKHTKFINGYGTSETVWISQLDPLILNDLIDRFDENVDMNVPAGTAVCDGIEIKIADDGKVIVRKEDDSGMIGYLGRDDLTKEVKTENGWFKTGDLGYIDAENGLLYLQGQKK